MSHLKILPVLSISTMIFSMVIFSFLFEYTSIAYAQENDEFEIWENEPVCEKAEKILSAKNKSLEQLPWISRDDTERERLISSLSSNELEVILTCVKSQLPELKSEIIVKKIGFFEGNDNHQVTGIARVITIENKDYLRFENFEIGYSGNTNPDLHVYLTKHDDFSSNIYLEKLKTKVGSKNYPLQDIDVSEFDTVIIYDQMSKEVFATIPLSNPSFIADMIVGTYQNLTNDVEDPKIDSQIIYKKTGILQGSNSFEAIGRIETPYEEDEAELKFEKFEISKGYDFHLYATKDGNVKKPGDWNFGPDNSIYVSNTNTNEILRYNATTGQFVDVFVDADDNGGMQGPKDLVFSPDGKYLYVSSFITNEILRYDGTTGKFVDKFVDKNSNSAELKRPMKIFLDHDGQYVYVTSVDNNQILKYDSDTGEIVYTINNTISAKDSPELVNPISITLDWNDFLYVSNTNTNEILRYNATTGQFVDVFVDADDNGGMQGPKDLVFSPDGKYLYVSSFITNEILRYDGTTGKFVDKFVSAYNGNVSNPKYIVFGPDNNLYVSSVNTEQILRFNGTDGKLLDVFIDRDVGGLKSPKGLTFGLQGDLFVSNSVDDSILRFFDNGTFRGTFVEHNLSLGIQETQQLITNTTAQINPVNNTDLVENIPLQIPRGLIDPEGIVFFPNCENDKELQTQKNNDLDDVTIDNQCYFLASSSKNNLIFRYIYTENIQSIFKDVFVTDEKIKNPQAITFGPDGNLYVSSFDTDEILRFNGTTGKFIDVFASSGGLDGPMGMLFDDESSILYVSSKNSNQIFKYDSRTGDFLGIFIQDDIETMQNPESIIKGPDNNFYVSSSQTNQILQYDFDGNLLEKFVSDKSGGLYQPKDLNFNKDGDLCVNSLVTNDIKCYDANDGEIKDRIDISFNRGLLGKPYSDFGPDGELYVSDYLSSTVSRYDRNTNLYSSKILSGEEAPLQGPRNLVFGPDDNLYVTSNNNHQILRLDGETGRFIDVFVTHSRGGLAAPQDLVFHDGHLYVTSNDNHRVLRYDQVTGNFIDDFVKSRNGELTEPRGLVFHDGHLYVASNENHKILRYNGITGVFEKEIGTGEDLQNPLGLAIDNNGNLLVSSSGNDRVLSYNIASPFVKPTVLISDEYLDDPAGLLVDSENDVLYVSSSTSNRILQYDFKTGEIDEIKELTDTASLEKPYGLAMQNEELFISNIESNTILKFDTVNEKAESFHSGSFGVLGPLGLTFGPDGNMYVISGRDHEIFKYDANNGDLLGTFSFSPFTNKNDESELPYGQLQDLVFSPDGQFLYVTSMYTDQILRFDGRTGEYHGVFIDLKKDGLSHPQNIVYSPDNKLFYVNSFDTGNVFAYDVQTRELVKDSNDNPRLNMKNMKFGPDGDLYLTSDDYAQVHHMDTESGNLGEFDLGGIYLGSLDQNLLKKKYLLNNINTTKHDTIVVYDHLLEREFATIPLQDDLVADFLPLPTIWNMIFGNIGNVVGPTFKSKDIEKQAGYFQGVEGIPSIGQVKLAHTEDTTVITLETFEMRYDENQYASFYTDEGITNGPKITACLTTGEEKTCTDEQNSIVLDQLQANVGDQVYVAKNIDLEKFDTVLLYDSALNQQYPETSLRDAAIMRVSPQLFVDWAQYQFPAFPLLLIGFIAFPLTFDYVRTVFKILFLSLIFSTKEKRKKLPLISTNKKITIMIPAHNEESGIKASIEAALKTKYKNKEIIVIDDKSSDNTFAIAKEFSDKGLIKLLHRKQASGSKASALNYGFAYATGDLILCMDGDTLLDTDSLQNAAAFFDDKEVKAVSGNVKILSGDDGVVNTLTRAQSYEYLIAIELGRSFTSILNILLVISGAFGVFRREIFSGTGKFDKDTITEDFDLTLKVRKTKGRIPFVKESIARTYCPNNWRAWMKQRQRWAHGQMQTLKKHSDLMLSSKFTRKDRIAMFDMWVLDIVMNFMFVIYLIALGPASIIMTVYGNVHILVNVLTLVIATYLISETVIFVFAVIVSRKYNYLKYLYLVPFMALFYRPFLKIVIFKSYIQAARNKETTW